MVRVWDVRLQCTVYNAWVRVFVVQLKKEGKYMQ